MKIYEIILLIISELGGILAGRTKIQKLCYFYSVLTKKEFGFRPHYYGPYSPLVENALDELEGIALIDKEVQQLGKNPEGSEMKRYVYGITTYGRQVVETISDSPEKTGLKKFVKKISENGIPETTDISIAAKAYYILAREKKPLTDGEIRKKAEAFGWDIDPKAINSAADFLKKLDLVDIDRNA